MSRLLLASLLLLALTGEVVASRVFFRKLAEVLTPQTPVIFARVKACRHERPVDQFQVFVKLEEVEVLQLRGPASKEIMHSIATNLERTVEGRVVHVSPIRDGSGLETTLKVGQRYFFLLDASGGFFIRAEPESSSQEIRALVGSH